MRLVTLNSAKYFDDVKVVAVCDPHLDSAAAVAKAISESTPESPQPFAGLAEAAESSDISLDAVDIVTSTPAHHTLAIEAMRAGLHVMVEKPMGLTSDRVPNDAVGPESDRHGALNLRELPP